MTHIHRPSRSPGLLAIATLAALAWACVAVYLASELPAGRTVDWVLFCSLLTCVGFAEWPWQRPRMHLLSSLTRAFVAIGALFWLYSAFDTWSVVRTGLPHVVTDIEGRSLGAFDRGVWTMKDAVDRNLEWATLPVIILVIQSVVAGIRSLANGCRLPASHQA